MSDVTLNTIQDQANQVESAFAEQKSALAANPSAKGVEELRVAFLGRKGQVTSIMEQMRNISKDDRPEAGKIINKTRSKIESAIEELKAEAEEFLIQQKLDQAPIDISLPVQSSGAKGSLHPVTLMRRVLLKEFRKLGFTVYDGPEVDLDLYNFSSLNFKDDHPARDMQDTFFVKDFDKTVLRTHTSNIQIHALMNQQPPLRVVSPGRTYRCDSDLTHTPMFHQIECLVVDQNISMGDMKGVIDTFLKAIFGDDLETRLRPSYFPFVEPGGEVDLQCVSCRGKGCRICSQTGWLEIGGLGMIHPNVFEAVGVDSERYTGFAFGFGIDRIAMLRYGLQDLRQLFEGNQQFLGQFPIQP
ncbi:phenylalanine--tRNA ligase subunit alpha [Pseudobacteriovorax antillogorgiicola]|uniref:Phenylalanine--tRNA ligase alpha subunit n=1 Tax=Pseudobacteriovorax antillogorgiicola TaxID=1513793 RepID=A0A1Y6CNM9_9BACT|nr:phenylalanine--tRNA ligase subunit alpha [Pseudobacteriovorax antillogorgiicola]TCS44442.1 phenylalanyl-tRNA synthetase alpha subunit [Pseudobacteriovorax antillogorgiicola]SMF78794.1 phenylalanyl-tRNA synthetase, alpha subunit [Pseudobacteriovorax antillogorgiicola]